MEEQENRIDDEIAALMKADGVDSAKIAEQIAKKSGTAVETVQEEIKPAVVSPQEVKPPDVTKPTDVPNPEAIRAAMLNEMFGEQFKTVEDVKKANIPVALQELATLRQKNQELDTLVKAKPKHNFANDDIAKMNEFVRETGITDVSVFNRINEVADIANMSDMDAVMLQHIIDNPRSARKDPQEVRKYIEMRYKVDPAKVESGDLTQDELNYNTMELEAQADKAKVKLQELKGKIKMPEIPKEEMPLGNTKWAPEVETVKKAEWNVVNTEMYNQFAKLPIYPKGAKEPIVNFELPEEAKSKIMGNAIDYIVSNQLEVNAENLKSVAQSMFSEIRDTYFEDIVHAVFERARSMTEKEYLGFYHNPSSKNTDIRPGEGEELSDEAKKDRAYQAELTR